jgi:hypothetical protein
MERNCAQKAASAKVKLAARLRAETTMTVDWIARRLGMGSRGYLNHLLYCQRKSARKQVGSSHYQEPTRGSPPDLGAPALAPIFLLQMRVRGLFRSTRETQISLSLS